MGIDPIAVVQFVEQQMSLFLISYGIKYRFQHIVILMQLFCGNSAKTFFGDFKNPGVVVGYFFPGAADKIVHTVIEVIKRCRGNNHRIFEFLQVAGQLL